MPPILDHVGLNVTDIDKSKAFYTAALAPLGILPLREYGTAVGYGKGGKPELWIHQGAASYQTQADLTPITPIHVCVSAQNRGEVDAFYAAALAAGGRDFGPPGIRAMYHPRYYGAFVLDPDGHNLEAAIHDA